MFERWSVVMESCHRGSMGIYQSMTYFETKIQFQILVPRARLELAHCQATVDFESTASTIPPSRLERQGYYNVFPQMSTRSLRPFLKLILTGNYVSMSLNVYNLRGN